MADQAPDSLFREIDEELRQEQYEKLWKKYGAYLVGAAVAIVLSVAGFKGWQAYDLNARQAAGEQFAKALALSLDEKSEQALTAFSTLAEEAGGYGMLARFQKAAHLSQAGDKAGAVAVYQALAADGGVPAVYQGLAVIQGALLQMDSADPVQLTARLAPLTADDQPLRFSARELTAFLALRAGDTNKAKELLQALSQDAAAPAGLRNRAAELLAMLGA